MKQTTMRAVMSDAVRPADPADRDELLEATFQDLTNQQSVAPTDIVVQMGRKLHVEKAGLPCLRTVPACAICDVYTGDCKLNVGGFASATN